MNLRIGIPHPRQLWSYFLNGLKWFAVVSAVVAALAAVGMSAWNIVAVAFLSVATAITFPTALLAVFFLGTLFLLVNGFFIVYGIFMAKIQLKMQENMMKKMMAEKMRQHREGESEVDSMGDPFRHFQNLG